jgi:predicted RNA-binding Zn-ribbon protein involved in translation (DUF1610 family)
LRFPLASNGYGTFLVVPHEVPCPPAGFSLLEKFTCPNCGREVFLTSTTHAEQYRREEIITARNAVTLNCPMHGITSVRRCSS